jgi:RNA polymerase sigma-32 factor
VALHSSPPLDQYQIPLTTPSARPPRALVAEFEFSVLNLNLVAAPRAALIIWSSAPIGTAEDPVSTIEATDMSIEGQFTGLTARARSQPALVTNERGSGYLHDIRRFAILEREQEYKLAKRWREHGDRDAANQLVTSHLRLAVKVAKGYRGYGLPVSEIISEGNVGLMQALNGFEPEKGFRFSTYAIWWIRAAIQDYILRSWSLVKIGTTANQRRLFFKLRAAQRKISAFERGDLHPDQVAAIATSLNVADQDVIDMNRRLRGDKSLNAPTQDGGEADEWQSYLVDQCPSPEAIVVEQDEKDRRRLALAGAIDVLNDRERRIFEARHLTDEPQTLEDLAVEFGVSRERVRQIEARAFEKVRRAAKSRIVQSPATTLMASLV